MIKLTGIYSGTGCGKDTFADILSIVADDKDIDVIKLSPSDYIKEIVAVTLGVTPGEVERLKRVKNYKYNVREMLKALAKTIREVTTDSFFIDRLIGDIEKDQRYIGYQSGTYDNDILIIVPGVRFIVEYNRLYEFTNANGIDFSMIKIKSDLDTCKEDTDVDELLRFAIPNVETVENRKGEKMKLFEQAEEKIFKWFGR